MVVTPNGLLTRRSVISSAIVASSMLPSVGVRRAFSQVAAFPLQSLPYPEDALAPVISANTIGFHYGKHHRAYVDNLNKLLEGSDMVGKPLEEIVKATRGDATAVALFNNAAQDWNHNFYWNSMRPGGGGAPSGALADRVKDSFGDYTKFRQEFFIAATTQFGSGWAWLTQSANKKLQVVKTANADTPMAQGTTCLLTCDLWEHAYYLDYQNRRADYVNAWLDKLVNWEFASKQLAS
jgi:Fe-Mn family superoxide dismutase